MLILYLCAIHDHFDRLKTTHLDEPHDHALQAVYIQAHHPFDAVEEFVTTSARNYALELVRYPPPMKEGFASFLADRPIVSAVFVGTRRTDPHGACLQSFHRTDHGWPDFERIHPVLDWRYADVWAVSFLTLHAPHGRFCSLSQQHWMRGWYRS